MPTLRDDIFTNQPRSNNLLPQETDSLAASGMGDLRRGWKSGRIGNELNPLHTEELEAQIAGDEAKRQALRQQIGVLEQRQQMYAPRVGDLRDIHGVGDGLDWAAGQVGQGVASMVDPMAASAGLGTVGRVANMIPHPIARGIGLAATGASMAVPALMSKRQLTGEFIGEAGQDKELMARTSPQSLRDMAGNYGALAAIPDSVIPGMIGRQMVGATARKAGERALLGPGAKTLVEMAGEGITEGGQAAGSQYARGLLNPNRDTSGDKWDIINNAAGGFIGAGPLSAAGAYSEAGHSRVNDGVGVVKGKAGDVIDLLNANPAVQEVKEAGKKWWQSGKDAVIDLQAAVANEDGNITPSSVAGAARDLGAKVMSAAEREAENSLLRGEMMPESMAADTSDAGIAAQRDWVMASDAKRANLVMSRLDAMGDDPVATKLADDIEAAGTDPLAQSQAVSRAAEHILNTQEASELDGEAASRADALGILAGAAGAAAGRGAVAVGKGAVKLGSSVLKGIKEGMRKKNAQAELDLNSLETSDPKSPYDNWLTRTGRNKTTLADEQSQAIESAKIGPAKPEAIKIAQAKEMSYRRAQLFGEKLASITKRVMGTRAQSNDMSGFMRDMGYEIADLADSWGLKEGGAKPDAKAAARQAPGLLLNIDSIANSLRVALGTSAASAVEEMRTVADPKSAPLFDAIQAKIEAGKTTAGREESLKMRTAAADQLLMLLPPNEAAQIQQETDGPLQLLKSIERMGRGYLSRAQRKQIERAVGGNKTLNEMLRVVGALAQPEEGLGPVVDDRATSGVVNDDPNMDDEAGPDTFIKDAAEKNFVKGAGPKVFGFHASPNLRTSNERRDPFSAEVKLTKEQQAERELLGESTMTRPKLFTAGQKLFGGKISAIEKKVADVRAQLAGDPKYPDHANYDVKSKTAHEVMKEMSMPQTKVLQLFRDYAGEEQGPIRDKAYDARYVIVRAMRINAVKAARMNGEPAPEFKPFKNAELRAAEERYVEGFREALETGQLGNNMARAREMYDADVRENLHSVAERYFKTKHVVVGEKLSNQDADQITLPEILDLHKEGQGLVERARRDDAAENNPASEGKFRHLSEANVLTFRSDAAGRNKEVHIPAGKLVNWVRQQRGKTEMNDSENNGGSQSNRSKNEAFLEDLSHGIASLIGSGYVKGMPYKINQYGKMESFSKGIPDSLTLATTTYYGMKKGDESRRSGRIVSDESLQTVGKEDYDAEVAADQNRNAEFFTPDDRAERELVVDDRRTKPRKKMTEQRASDAGGELVTRDVGRGTSTKIRVDVSGQVAQNPKTDDPDKTPLDFAAKPKDGAVPDEYANQRWLSRQTGASTDQSPGPETKPKAISSARFRAEQIMAAFRDDPEAGTEAIQARLRTAMRSGDAKADAQGLVGGAHYVAPLAYLVNRNNVAEMKLSESEQEMMDDVRKKVAEVILKGDANKNMKVQLARLMSTDPSKVTAMNVDALMSRVAGGVTEGKKIVAKPAPEVAGAALPKGQLTLSGGVELTGGPTFAMNYADGQRVVGKGTLTMRPEHAGKDTMDLILSGDRTATTGSLGRFNGAKKGDVVMATGNGKRALIRFTSDPYPVAKMDAQEWSRLEGWAPEVLEKYRGDYQATYERVSLEASGVRKLNAMATRIHTDLGREGFAATHDSPIKHEGKFDWREHKGKGEGNAAFGAGTYLSTADGVHRSYKDQFTRKASGAHQGAMLGEEWVKGRIAELQKALRQLQDYMGEYKVVAWDRDIGEYKVTDPSDRESYGENIILIDDLVGDVARELQELRKPLTKSPTYEVSVNIKPEQLLDWNAPLSEQSELVQKALAKAGFASTDYRGGIAAILKRTAELNARLKNMSREEQAHFEEMDQWHEDNPIESAMGERNNPRDERMYWVRERNKINDQLTAAKKELTTLQAKASRENAFSDGGSIYRALTRKLGSQAAASDYLQSLGILGHRFNAAGGRNDTHPNYVIYDDSKITTNYVHFNAQTDRTGGAYEGWKDGPSRVSTQAERDEAVAYAKKVLGPKIKVEFKDITGYSGEFIDATNTIVISTTAAAGTMNTLYHEALHKFFADFVKSDPKVQAMFETLVNDPTHLAKLHALLDGYPAAQAQLTSGEERLAFTYQFWKAGLLDVDTKAHTWLQKVGKFFRRVAGMVRDSERALELFEAFDQGKLAEPSAAGKVIAKAMAKGTASIKFRHKMDALVQGLAALTIPSAEILGKSKSPTARKLSLMFFTNPGEESHGQAEPGLLNARRSVAAQYVNTANRRFEGMSERDRNAVQKYLQSETDLQSIPLAEHREAVKDIRQLLERFHKYMTDAGMKIGKLENYYPVVWSTDALMNKRNEFIKMLTTKYAAELSPINGTLVDAAERVWTALVNKDGVDSRLAANREDGVLNPFFASQGNRTLSWLKGEDREQFLEKNMQLTLTRYFNQGAHATEYFRRFGEGGKRLEKMLFQINNELSVVGKEMLRRGELKDEKARVAWVGRQMRDVTQATGAMEGSLGKDVSPSMRKFNSYMTVYQNIRLLPMALFSSFVDPLALVARGAPMKAAYETFVYSMREVFRNWADAFKDMPPNRQKDEWRQLSELIGASEIAMFQHHVSEEYSSAYLTPGAKKLNDKMFTFNGMEAWNRGSRIMATKWAVRFIEQHAGLPDKHHSARWLKELGLTPEMITKNSEGNLVTTPQELAVIKGITLDEAREQIAPIHRALNRWVEGAVLTPNAAQRPSWSSDPNFASLFHLKQFSYSFHQTILKRAANEFEHGNIAPLGALAMFVPMMIGADIMKGLIQGGGTLPPHLAGMNAGDWVTHGVQRAGLSGIGVIGVDAVNDWASLGGPAFEQLVDAARDGFGSKSALNAMPLHALYGQMVR